MVFIGDQLLPTGYKRGGGGAVENYLPFYCHQGEGGHKKTGGGGYQVNHFVLQPNSLTKENLRFVKTIYN